MTHVHRIVRDLAATGLMSQRRSGGQLLRLGAALRAAYALSEVGRGETTDSGRSGPRAHLRRAHWHMFLAGAGRTERRLKWLPPIPVNVEYIADLPAAIRRISDA